MDQEHASQPLDNAAFTPREQDHIAARVGTYPAWNLEFTTSGGIGYAHLNATGPAPSSPRLTLARDQGRTCFAATWPDGRTFRASLGTSLAQALSYLANILDGAFDDTILALNPADPGPAAAPESA